MIAALVACATPEATIVVAETMEYGETVAACTRDTVSVSVPDAAVVSVHMVTPGGLYPADHRLTPEGVLVECQMVSGFDVAVRWVAPL